MEKRITKNYDNGEVTVVWQPHKCIHSAICFRGLPAVFDPQKRPWVNIQGADTETIIAQVEKCPSGALSYQIDRPQARNGHPETPVNEPVIIELQPNGPLLLHGEVLVKGTSRETEKKDKITAFCRCGYSQNKPYCDGSHAREGWKS